MDSETKLDRAEGRLPTLLGHIRDALRPMLLKKWRASRASALASAATEGLTEIERDLFLAGHQTGYWQGAVDAAEIKPSDLRRTPTAPRRSKIH